MNEELAKALIEAMNRLSAAIERMSGMNGLSGGINVYHHGAPSYQPYMTPYSPYYQSTFQSSPGGHGSAASFGAQNG